MSEKRILGNSICLSISRLNYEVVGSTSVPMPSDKVTIWVNTATPISSHSISATEPVLPEDGMVWIKTADRSLVAFSALSDTTVMIYPTSAKQYIGGSWVPKECHVNIDGAWKAPFDGRLYAQGIIYADITEELSPATAKINYLGDRIKMSTVKSSVSEVYTVFGPVSIENVTQITMKGFFSDEINGTHYARVFLGKNLGMSYKDADIIATKTVSGDSTSSFTQALSINNLNGFYYVYAGTTAGDWTYRRDFNLTELSASLQ